MAVGRHDAGWAGKPTSSCSTTSTLGAARTSPDPLMFTTGTIPEPAATRTYRGSSSSTARSSTSSPATTSTVISSPSVQKRPCWPPVERFSARSTWPSEPTDYSSSITRVVAAGPEVVYGSVVGEDAIAFCKQYYDTGLIDKHRLVEPVDATALVASGPDVVEGCRTCQAYFDAIDTPANKAFVEAYKEFAEPDTLPTDITASFYIALQCGARLSGWQGRRRPRQSRPSWRGSLWRTPRRARDASGDRPLSGTVSVYRRYFVAANSKWSRTSESWTRVLTSALGHLQVRHMLRRRAAAPAPSPRLLDTPSARVSAFSH